jgi:16S rRNA processing protein RimM
MNLLEAGMIVNTHGIRGEVKILPWCDSPAFLCSFDVFYLDGEPVEVRAARVHGRTVIASLAGVETVNEAMRLRDKVVMIDRSAVKLPEGRYFIADLIGLNVLDDKTGASIGTLADVLTLPANDVYVVRGTREYMIPAVPEFLAEIDLPGRTMRVNLIEGMETDAD